MMSQGFLLLVMLIAMNLVNGAMAGPLINAVHGHNTTDSSTISSFVQQTHTWSVKNIIPKLSVALVNRGLSDSTTTNTTGHTSVGGRITYAVVGFLVLIVLSGMFATRMKTLMSINCLNYNFIRVLTTLIYLLGIFFILAAGILIDGTDLSSEKQCHAGILLCLVFYVGGKVVLYLFLVERAHLIRAIPRKHDWMFFAGILIIACGFGPIAGFAFARPEYEVSHIDNKCRIGLPRFVTIPLLVYDILINIGITAMFIVFVRSYTKDSKNTLALVRLALPIPFIKPAMEITKQAEIMELMVVKSFLGAVAVIIPTVANLVVLLKLHGKEQGWLCFTLCTIDICWSVMVVHWLTSNPLERGDQKLPAPIPEYMEMRSGTGVSGRAN